MKSIISFTALWGVLLFTFFSGSAQVAAVQFTVYVPGLSNTDKGVFMAGSFNSWNPGDTLYRMNKVGEGVYSITLPVFANKKYEYKYALGKWDRSEVTSENKETNNRVFVSADKESITDTVVKWKTVQPAANNISPQLQQLNAKKDSLMKKLQPELDNLLVLLRKDIMNLLQPEPSKHVQKQLHKKAVKKVSYIHTEISKLLWDVLTSLTPEQKQYILKAINQPAAQNDFINTLGKAFGEVMSEKKPE
jgi:hypothetical protein